MSYRRKLIEVALPLEAINKESAREKLNRYTHPNTLHLWWSRKPLATCRAVLFAQLVDDPSEYMVDEKAADVERERLFDLIEELVLWENINNEEVLDKAKLEIARSVARDLGVDVPVGKQAILEFLATQAPPVLDPFAGGGSIPLEAQRLGLRAYASDLNPVAVLINKALIEIPPKFAGMPPVHPPENKDQQLSLVKREWRGAEGLAEDVRYYGKWMRDEAYKRIGHLYPPVKITEEILAERTDLKSQGLKDGDELTVIAWLWVRTVRCSNPACGLQAPLTAKWWLSNKRGKRVWVEPQVDLTSQPPEIHFAIRMGEGQVPDGTVNRNGAKCLACNTPLTFDYVRSEGKAGRIHQQLIAIVTNSIVGRIYLEATQAHEVLANSTAPDWIPDTDLPNQALGFRIQLYGMTKHADLFSKRQLVALTTFCDLIGKIHSLILTRVDDQLQHSSCPHSLDFRAYADAIVTYLGFVIDRLADYWSSLNSWQAANQQLSHTFARQALPMVWDFAEANPFSGKGGSFDNLFDWTIQSIPFLNVEPRGICNQEDASTLDYADNNYIISTDPPYYDNIGYADLSDFFYIWLRKSISKIYPKLFTTMLVPKSNELIATPFRFGGNKESADRFFEDGLRRVFEKIFKLTNHSFPLTLYYAFKQAETDNGDLELQDQAYVSTGWETMLTGLLFSGFQITGTWPIRTEMSNRSVSIGTNSLASSIVLVCRPRSQNAIIITRRDFMATLKRELPLALRQLQLGYIAPVDFAQAAIGPGMAVFSRYKAVLEADGTPMRVRTALGLINQALDEFLAEQEGEYDTDTRWALAWYEQYGHEQGPYGVAETLSTAKNTSVEGLVDASILEARAGKVRLLRRDELDKEWDPQKDKRPTAWEACQHLIYALEKGGEQTAAGLLAKLGGLSETARDLAYRLYTVCERKGWAQDALGYNMLVVAWPRLRELAGRKKDHEQKALF